MPQPCAKCSGIEPKCSECEQKEIKRKAANKRRRERDELMRSLGLVKVRGAVSGRVYWE